MLQILNFWKRRINEIKCWCSMQPSLGGLTSKSVLKQISTLHPSAAFDAKLLPLTLVIQSQPLGEDTRFKCFLETPVSLAGSQSLPMLLHPCPADGFSSRWRMDECTTSIVIPTRLSGMFQLQAAAARLPQRAASQRCLQDGHRSLMRLPGISSTSTRPPLRPPGSVQLLRRRFSRCTHRLLPPVIRMPRHTQCHPAPFMLLGSKSSTLHLAVIIM